MELINNKYRVLSEINPTMFVVRDLQDNERKAIRIADGGIINETLRDFFINAFPSYRNIRSPEILKSYGFGLVKRIDGKRNPSLSYFLLSEYAGYEIDLHQPFDEPTVLSLFAQACRAVYYMHLKNMVHGGICPDTVSVTEESGVYKLRLKSLADMELWRRSTAKPGLYFMSQEAAFDGKISAAGDIYSLGVLLYILAGGRQGRDFTTDYAAHKRSGANEFNTRLFPIIDRMTANADKRLTSVKDALDAVNAEFGTGFASFDEAVVKSVNSHINLVGRSNEEAVITEVFDQLVAGLSTPRYICIRGGYGAGTTALLYRLKAKWEIQGGTVYSAFNTHGDTLRSLLRELLADYDTEDSSAGIVRQVNAFIEGTESETVTSNMLLKFIYDCVKNKSSAFIIDAAHLATPESLDIMRKLMNVSKKTILLLAYRADYDNDSFTGFINSLPDDRLEIPLHSLGQEDTFAYVREKLSLASTPAALAKEVFSATQGNPLFIDEILKSLLRSDILRIDDEGRWQIEYSSNSQIPMPSTIKEISSEQASRLKPAQKELLEVMSVFNTPVTSAELAACAGTDADEAAAIADECVTFGYVTKMSYREGNKYFLEFKMLRDFLYNNLSAKVKASLHKRASRIMEERGDGAFLAEIVYHLEQADSEGDRLAVYLLEIGRRLMGVGVLQKAISTFEKALTLPNSDRVEILLSLGWAWQFSGNMEKSNECLLMAASAVRSNPNISYRAKVYNQCAGTADWVLKELRDIFVNRPALKLEMEEEYYGMLDGLARVETDMQKKIETAKTAYGHCPEKFNDIRAGLLLSWGYGEYMQGNARAAAAVWDKARPFLDELTNMRYLTLLLNNLSGAAQIIDDFETSKLIILEGIDLCSQHGLLYNQGLLLISLLNCYFRCAEYDKTIALAREIAELEEIQSNSTNWHLFRPYLYMCMYSEAYEQAELIDAGTHKVGHYEDQQDITAYASYLAGRAMLALHMGDDDEAKRFLDLEAKECEGKDLTDYDNHMFVPFLRIYDVIKEGRPSELPGILRQFNALTERHGSRQEVLFHLAELLLAMYDSGGFDSLKDGLDASLKRLGETGTSPFVRARYCYLKAAVEEGVSRLNLLREALKLSKAYNQPLLLAKVYIALGNYYIYDNRFHSLQYYNEADKVTEELLKHVPERFHDSFISRHKLAIPADMLLEDPSVWASAKEAYYSLLPENCETPEDLILHIGRDAHKNLSLIARFLAAVTHAGRAEIITEGAESEFEVLASEDGDLELTCSKQTLRRVKSLEEDMLIVNHHNALICIPIILDKTLMGYIYLFAEHRFHKFDAEGLKTCKRLAPLTALNIQQITVKEGAYTDRLTGVLNSKAFDMEFDRILRGVREMGGSFSLTLCDLDKFKSINDTFGHQTGDDILRSVGRLFRSHLPEKAVIGRIGGDEFAILLAGYMAADTVAAVDAVRKAISNAMLLGSKRAVTLSAGSSVYGLHDDSKTGLKELADKALYVCKERGRNQVTLYDPSFSAGKSHIHHAMDGIVSADALRDSERIRFILGMVELMRVKAAGKRRLVLSKMTEILHAETGVWLEATESGFSIAEYAFGMGSGYSSASDLAAVAGRVYDEDKAAAVAQSRNWALYKSGDEIQLYAPIIKAGAVTAVICISQKPGGKPFTHDDGNYLRHLCSFAGAI
jgi:diguanylate cyclase (GGDEF)-like protein